MNIIHETAARAKPPDSTLALPSAATIKAIRAIARQSLGDVVARYPYTDEHGKLAYIVVRFSPKDFRPIYKNGTWRAGRGDGPRFPYHLPDVLAAIKRGETIHLAEGEKSADALRSLGFAATCNDGGAGKWTDAHSAWFAGADVALHEDNDKAGRDDVASKAASLHRAGAARVRIVRYDDLADKADVADFIAAGATADQVIARVAAAPEWTPPVEDQEPQPERKARRTVRPTDDTTDRIKASIDLAGYMQQDGIALKKSGNVYKGRCPFHDDRGPSLAVYPDADKWHCFGACGEGGDVYDYVQRRDGVDFGQAKRTLASVAGVDLPDRAPVAATAGDMSAAPDMATDDTPISLQEFIAELWPDSEESIFTAKTAAQVEAERQAAASHDLMRRVYPDWEFLHVVYFLLGLKQNKYVKLKRDYGGVALLLLAWHELIYSGHLSPREVVYPARLHALAQEHNRYFALGSKRDAGKYFAQAAELELVTKVSTLDKTYIQPAYFCPQLPETGRKPAFFYGLRAVSVAERAMIDSLTQHAATELAYEREPNNSDPRPYTLIEAEKVADAGKVAALPDRRADQYEQDAPARAAAERRIDTARKKLTGWLAARGTDRAMPLPDAPVNSVPRLREFLLQHLVDTLGDDLNPGLVRSMLGYSSAAYRKALARLELRTVERKESGALDVHNPDDVAALDEKKYGFAYLKHGTRAYTVRPGESVKTVAAELAQHTARGTAVEYVMQLTPDIVPIDTPVSEAEQEQKEKRSEAGKRGAATRADRRQQQPDDAPKRKDRHPDRYGEHFTYWQIDTYLTPDMATAQEQQEQVASEPDETMLHAHFTDPDRVELEAEPPPAELGRRRPNLPAERPPAPVIAPPLTLTPDAPQNAPQRAPGGENGHGLTYHEYQRQRPMLPWVERAERRLAALRKPPIPDATPAYAGAAR